VPAGYTVQARAGYRAPLPPPIRPTIEFHVTNAEQEYVALAADVQAVLLALHPRALRP